MTQITMQTQQKEVKEENEELQVKSNLIPTTIIHPRTNLEMKVKSFKELVEIKIDNRKFIWEKKYVGEGNKEVVEKINMKDMSEVHLQNAFYKCQHKAQELQKLLNGWLDLADQIEKTAESKRIELKESDTSFIKIH